MEDDSRGITAAGFAPTIPRRLRERLMRGKLHKGEDAQVLRTVHGMIYLRERTLAPAAQYSSTRWARLKRKSGWLKCTPPITRNSGPADAELARSSHRRERRRLATSYHLATLMLISVRVPATIAAGMFGESTCFRPLRADWLIAYPRARAGERRSRL